VNHENKWLRNVFRHYIQYLYYKRRISPETFGWIMEVVPSRSYRLDVRPYQISLEDVRKTLEFLRSKHAVYYTVYRVMLESGARFEHVLKMIEAWNPDEVVEIPGVGIDVSNISIANVKGNITIDSASYGVDGGSTLVLSFVSARFINISSVGAREGGRVFIVNCSVTYGGGITIGTTIGLAKGDVSIEYCNIYGNNPYGLKVGGGFVKAEHNWWGDPSGPYHPSINPEGKGDKIEADPNAVDFISWLERPLEYLNKPPVPVLRVEPSAAVVGQLVVFDAGNSTDDGRVVAYFFDFGDGDVSGWVSTAFVNHRYAKPGNYTVTLMVKDDLGAVSEINATAVVTVLPVEISLSGVSVTSQLPKELGSLIDSLYSNVLLNATIEASVKSNVGVENMSIVLVPLYSKEGVCGEEYRAGNEVLVPLKLVQIGEDLYRGVATLNLSSNGFSSLLSVLGAGEATEEPVTILVKSMVVKAEGVNETVNLEVGKTLDTALGLLCKTLRNTELLYFYSAEPVEIAISATNAIRLQGSEGEQVILIPLTPGALYYNITLKPLKGRGYSVMVGYLVGGKLADLKRLEGSSETSYQVTVSASKLTINPVKIVEEKPGMKTQTPSSVTSPTASTTPSIVEVFRGKEVLIIAVLAIALVIVGAIIVARRR